MISKEVKAKLEAAKAHKGSTAFNAVLEYLEAHVAMLNDYTSDVADDFLVAHKYTLKTLKGVVKNLRKDSKIITSQEDGAYFQGPAPGSTAGKPGTH